MDDKVVYASNLIASGSGTLEVLGLTTDEKCLLFGGQNMKGGFAMGNEVNQPAFALLFEQKKADGGKILHVLYNCTFSPDGINAQTLEEGQVEETTESLEFTSILGDCGYFYYSVDTRDAKADQQLVKNFFTQVQIPQAN
jgi:phi13 family phage major tail protein